MFHSLLLDGSFLCVFLTFVLIFGTASLQAHQSLLLCIAF